MNANDLDETFFPVGLAKSRATQSGAHLPETNPGRADVIRLAGFEPRSFVAGPGMRSMVWVAGCHRRCPGCSQPEFFGFDVGQDVPVETLWQRIAAIPDLDGISFSGGEPFEQARPLAALAKLAHANGKTVVSYTGYRLEALEADRERFGSLLNEVDLLIDGEFRADQTGHYRWRGSGNQRLICLTDRIRLPAETDVTEMQITFDAKGSGLVFSGILAQDLIRELRAKLSQQGFATSRRGRGTPAPETTPPDGTAG
jgi:anaerobic ribonucleoside-triphosphate reductase activating protein